MILVGLMSGTSLDGISAAVVRFHTERAGIATELLAFITQPYPPDRRQRLAAALTGATPEEYCRLAFDLGAWLADAAIAAIIESGIATEDIAAIASHGQTIWHQPPHSTWQLGEAAMIAERCRVPVISDFRVRDVAAGGQGAPLVPIADAVLFSDPSHWRALQNLGGIGNVTVVPPGGDTARVRAFDTGPGVSVIDGVTRRLEPSLPFDVDGALARSGTPSDGVVTELLAHPYFAASPPKSTGRELFTGEYIDALITNVRADRPQATTGDIVATAVQLTARSIADAYRRWIPEAVSEILISGGGARNPALVDAITRAVSPTPVAQFDDRYFDGEAKEAVAFAFLGYLHLRGEAGNVPSATGAKGERVLGKLTPA